MTPDTLHIDATLLLRISQGDEIAFESLYIQYAKNLIPFLDKLTRNTGVSQDLVQQTFLSVWLHRDQLPDLDNPKAWIFRIAANHASTWMTKAALIRQSEARSSNSEDITLAHPAVQLDLKEARRLADQAIEQLSPQRKKIFQLYRDRAMSYAEIAQELNISPSTVRTSVSLALQHIRETLGTAGLGIFIIFFRNQ